VQTPPPDERSPAVVAYAWASRITTVALEMVLPGVGGYWLDGRVGTLSVFPVFTLLGFALGLTLGIWHLLKMVSPADGRDKTDSGDSPTNDDSPSR